MDQVVLTLHEFGLHKTINEYSNPYCREIKRKKKKHRKKAAISLDEGITQKGSLKLRLKDKSIKIIR
jgi:hypothetical protein